MKIVGSLFGISVGHIIFFLAWVLVNLLKLIYNNDCNREGKWRSGNAADCKSAMHRFKSGLALHFYLPGWRNWQTHGT